MKIYKEYFANFDPQKLNVLKAKSEPFSKFLEVLNIYYVILYYLSSYHNKQPINWLSIFQFLETNQIL